MGPLNAIVARRMKGLQIEQMKNKDKRNKMMDEILNGIKIINTGPFFVEWININPIFHYYLILFLLEAVEASRYHFFENWLMKLKCPNLLKPLDTII